MGAMASYHVKKSLAKDRIFTFSLSLADEYAEERSHRDEDVTESEDIEFAEPSPKKRRHDEY